MKAYLLTTGTIFGLMAVMHVWQAIHDFSLLTTRPMEYLPMAALGALAACLSWWAWRLLRH